MENNNGKGIFYGVIGVATLVVAIIGATFAYFSATVTPNDESQPITGTTNSDFASTLDLKVTRLSLGATVTSDDLVPADFGATPTTLAVGDINRALTAKCVNDGYTGCHVWKIEATSDQTISHANINLDLSVTATDPSQWSYAIYTGSDTTASALATVASPGTAVGTFGTTALDGLDIHNNAGLTAETTQTYYLMVYLNNENKPQNSTENSGSVQTGTYTGSVEMQAAGGQVKASFAA